ncbi:MAG: hypothetical protein ABIQ89_02270 [Candidatus Saccharimonadales bacterium]
MKKQDGFVSIIVALIVMIFVTLIALGFAFVARQNHSQNQNRLLSTQAFYAAEAGVNDASDYINTYIQNNGTTPPDITSCQSGSVVPLHTNTVGSSNSEVKYTCVLIDQSPKTLVYDSISKDESTVIHIRTSSPVSSLNIGWEDSNGDNTGFADAGSNFYLPQAKAIAGNANSPFLTSAAGKKTALFPNHTGMLRTTIIPASAASSSDSLLNNSQTIFLYPREGAVNTTGSVAFRAGASQASEGVFGPGNCNSGTAPRDCNTQITGINSSDFYIRLRAIYKPVAVTITAKDGLNNALAVTGAQKVVDSTGKASDVLRRIQVRLPAEPSYYFPEFAVESANTICKRLTSWVGGAEVEKPSDYLYDTSGNGGGEKNDKSKDSTACQLPGEAKPF